MMKKLKFNQFSEEMTERYQYSNNDILSLYRTIQRMDRESKGWVITWFFGGGLPQKEVEGVTADYLVYKYGLKPLNALIVLDWLKADPETAKYVLLKNPQDMVISESVKNEMRNFLEEKGALQEIPSIDKKIEDIEI